MTVLGGKPELMPEWRMWPLTHWVWLQVASNVPGYAPSSFGEVGGGTPTPVGKPPSCKAGWYALTSEKEMVLLRPSVTWARRMFALMPNAPSPKFRVTGSQTSHVPVQMP